MVSHLGANEKEVLMAQAVGPTEALRPTGSQAEAVAQAVAKRSGGTLQTTGGTLQPRVVSVRSSSPQSSSRVMSVRSPSPQSSSRMMSVRSSTPQSSPQVMSIRSSTPQSSSQVVSTRSSSEHLFVPPHASVSACESAVTFGTADHSVPITPVSAPVSTVTFGTVGPSYSSANVDERSQDVKNCSFFDNYKVRSSVRWLSSESPSSVRPSVQRG